VKRDPSWYAILVRCAFSHCISAYLIIFFTIALASPAADEKTAMTLADFRSQISSQQAPAQATTRSSNKKSEPQAIPAVNLDQADNDFYHVLSAQGNVSAARQSVDRLAGWLKSAETRLQAQSTSETDVALLRLAEGRAASRVARFEAERLDAVRAVNVALKRSNTSQFIALSSNSGKPTATEEIGDKQPKPSVSPDKASPKNPDISPDLASRRAQFETDLLPAGNDLLGMTYQSYLFGGRSLTELLWQEQEVFRTDLEYRQLLVELEKQAGLRSP
jgi:hypothetical protein